MFTKSAKFYDALYSWKDYAKEAGAIHEAIESHKSSPGMRLLDVACGTGKHLEEFSTWYAVDGIDLNPTLLAEARRRLANVELHEGDMRTFHLGRKFDAVTCLFSSIGYMTTLDDLALAVQNMAAHLVPGGVLIVEPWLYPDQFKTPHLHLLTVDGEDIKIARIARSSRDGNMSVMDFEYLAVTHEKVSRDSEQHVMGLFGQLEYSEALERAGLRVEYDPIGPMGRGLFIGAAPG